MLNTEQWYRSPTGLTCLSTLTALLQPTLQNCVGYHGVQIGASTLDILALTQLRARHYFNPAKNDNTAVFSPESLPFRNNSIDVFCINHFPHSADPLIILGEAERVLVDQGLLIVVNFLRYAAWRPASWLQHHLLTAKPPLETEARDILRMTSLFSFQKMAYQALSSKTEKHIKGWFYNHIKLVDVLILKKQMLTVTPVKINWQTVPFKLSDSTAPTPSTREITLCEKK